eukprot:137896-Chlamydomonas_euryale.AAC.5
MSKHSPAGRLAHSHMPTASAWPALSSVDQAANWSTALRPRASKKCFQDADDIHTNTACTHRRTRTQQRWSACALHGSSSGAQRRCATLHRRIGSVPPAGSVRW